MRVLLTNDDGYQSGGIAAIRESLIAAGAEVITVAPDENCSGFARKCTFNRPVTVRRSHPEPNPIYFCDGTPTDCVRVGLLGGLARDANLVVSGINHGANLADDIMYSGTVGAGLEAALLGKSALCLSQQTPTGSFSVNYTQDLDGLGLAYDFDLAATHGSVLAMAMAVVTSREPLVLSVNYPTAPVNRTAVLTRPGRREYSSASAGAWGLEEVVREIFLFGEPDEDIPESAQSRGTDIAALRSGLISVTPLSQSYGVADLHDEMRTYLKSIANGLSQHQGFGIKDGGLVAVKTRGKFRTIAERRAAVSQLEAGATVEEVCTSYGVSETTVNQWRLRIGTVGETSVHEIHRLGVMQFELGN